jgi:hypothetical protein
MGTGTGSCHADFRPTGPRRPAIIITSLVCCTVKLISKFAIQDQILLEQAEWIRPTVHREEWKATVFRTVSRAMKPLPVHLTAGLRVILSSSRRWGVCTFFLDSVPDRIYGVQWRVSRCPSTIQCYLVVDPGHQVDVHGMAACTELLDRDLLRLVRLPS